MKKFLLILSAITLIFVGCIETSPTADTNDNTGNDNPESVSIMKQVDSLFQAMNVQPPDDWGLKYVHYSINPDDGNRRLGRIIYSSGKGDRYKSHTWLNYSNLFTINKPIEINDMGMWNIGLILAYYEFYHDEETNIIRFGRVCRPSYEYSNHDQVNKITKNEFMLGEVVESMNFFYSDQKLLSVDSPDFNWSFSYGNNGMINRKIATISYGEYCDTTYYEQNMDRYLTSVRRIENNSDGKRSETLEKYVYSPNRITINYYSSIELSEIVNVETFTYQDIYYQKLISYESYLSSDIYEYNSNKITEGKTEYKLNGQNRLIEINYYNDDHQQLSNQVFEYYTR